MHEDMKYHLLIIFISLQYYIPSASSPLCGHLCMWGSWTSWSTCSKTCGVGEQTRERTVCCTSGLSFTECAADCGLLISDRLDYISCNEHCFNGGTFSDECLCDEGYSGSCCSDDIDECETNICKNGGSCQNTPGSYNCDCTEFWSGTNCTDDIDECETDICRNNGSCQNTPGSYNCDCTEHWSGISCTDDIDECETDICRYNGSCQNTPGSYNCDCTEYWSGTHCTDDIDECETDICRNNGSCQNTPGSYNCDCTEYWSGINCTDDIDECETDICRNNGSCQNTPGSYNCDCTEYWSGTNCTDDIDECKTNICKNGGSCQNTPGSYNCNCTENWSGANCTDDIGASYHCTTSRCKYGCCGHGNCQHCCKNEIAIGYVAASVVAATMLTIGGAVALFIKCRHLRGYRKSELKTKSTQTKITVPPATEWNITSYPRRGSRYVVNGRFTTPPPPDVLYRIMQIRHSFAKTSRETKHFADPEPGKLESKPINGTVKRQEIRFSDVKRKPSSISRFGNILTIEEID